MNNHNLSSDFPNKQSKDTNINMNTPDFQFDKYGIGIEDIKTEAEQLLKKTEATPHAEILHQLIKQLEQLDFEVLANPHNAENHSPQLNLFYNGTK